jgi:hypothetical protein
MKTTHIEMDKLRKIRYDFNSLGDLEFLTKKTTTQLLAPLYNSSFYAIRAFLWAGLKWEDPALQNPITGIDKAGELAGMWIEKSGGNVGDLAIIIIGALESAGWIVPLNHDVESEGEDTGEVTEASTD